MNYRDSLVTKAAQSEILKALTTEICSWWTEDFSGSAKRVKEEFTVRFGNTFKTFVVVELSSTTVSWKCMDSYIDMPDLNKKDEWIGTTIHWAIGSDGHQNCLELFHEGLTPEIECFDVCRQGWISFLASLRNWLETKEGSPYRVPNESEEQQA
jgi:hypothetical protein